MGNNKVLHFLIHFMVWGLVFVLPFLTFWRNSDIDFSIRLQHQSVSFLSLLIVFYVNFFWLIEYYLFQKKELKYILYNLVLVLLVAFLVHSWKENNLIHAAKDNTPPPTLIFLFRDAFSLIVVVGLSIAIKMTEKWYVTEKERQEMEQKRSKAELINLRQQLNPHFLFNTLNNIYALIGITPDKAQETVLELSRLLRYVLYDNNENFVSLKQELDFVDNYVKLMRLRLTSNIEVQFHTSVQSYESKVAPLLFITLIENAFKHGTSPTKTSFIHVDIIETENKRLICLVRNSYFPKDESDKSGSGIGLENLRRRLEILYPNNYSFKTEVIDNTYTAELNVPL